MQCSLSQSFIQLKISLTKFFTHLIKHHWNWTEQLNDISRFPIWLFFISMSGFDLIWFHAARYSLPSLFTFTFINFITKYQETFHWHIKSTTAPANKTLLSFYFNLVWWENTMKIFNIIDNLQQLGYYLFCSDKLINSSITKIKKKVI